MTFDTGGAGAVNLGSAYGEINVSMDAAQRQLNNQIGQLERSVTSSFGRIGSHVQALGVNMTKILLPVTGFVVGGIASFAKFDDILTEIEARTGATAEEMENVRLTALQMGTDTAFSATQASQGMLELMSSGFSLEETMTALVPVLDLAAAGMLDLGFAADAVTDILAQFGLTAEDATMVVDALAQASGSSSATITDLVQGFANVGPIASNFGLSVRETAAALAVFSENGIKGAQAGTSLKSMLTHMASDVPRVKDMWDELGISMFDAEGQMRDFDDVIDDLNIAMEGMSDEERIRVIQTLAGSYGQIGLSALLASDGIDTMLISMDDAATAAALGAARMASFRGVINQLKSSIETIALQVIGPLVEKYLQPLVEEVVRLLNVFNAWLMLNPALAESLGVILGVLAVLGPAITLLGMVISAVLSPIGLLVSAFGAVLKFNLFGIRDGLDSVIDGFERYARVLRMGGSWTAAFRLGMEKAFGRGILDRIVGFWDSIRNAIISVWSMISPIMTQMVDALDDLLAPFGGLEKAFKTFGKILISILIPPLGLLMKFGSIFEILSNIFKGGAKNIGKNIGDMFSDIVDTLEIFIPQVINRLAEAGSALVNWIADAIPKVVIGMAELGTAFLQWIGPAFREFFPKLGEFFGSAIEWILGDGIPMLLEAGAKLGVAFIQWIIDVVPKMGKALGKFIKAFGKFIIKDFLPGIVGFAKNIGTGLVKGLSKLGTFLWEDVLQPAINSLSDWITSGQAMTDLGNLATAIKDGLVNAIRSIAEGVTMFWDNFLKPAILGLVEWITSGGALRDFEDLASSIVDGLSTGLNSIAEGVTMFWDNFLKPAILDVVEWLKSGQAMTDFQTLVTAIIEGLTAAVTSYNRASDWMWVNIVKPMVLDLIEWFGSGQALTDLITLATAILDAFKMAFDARTSVINWFWVNVFKPLLDSVINWFSSGQAAADLITLASAILEALRIAFMMIVASGDWMWVNVFKPMVLDVIEWFRSGQASTDLFTLVTEFLKGLANQFLLLGEGVSWLWTSVFRPMIYSLIAYISSGEAGTDFQLLANSILDSLSAAFTAVVQGVSWLWNDMLKPMIADAIDYFTSGKAKTDLMELASSIMDALKTGFSEVKTWAEENIVQPMVDAIETLPDRVQAALDSLLLAFAVTFGAVEILVTNLGANVANGIGQTFNGVIDVINGFIDRYNDVAYFLPGIDSIDHLTHISFQKGTPWTGSGPLDQPAGVVENREAVVPAHGMSVTPSPGGLKLNGLIETLRASLNKIFDGIDSNLLGSMNNQGGSAALGATAGAGGFGGGSSETTLNFMGDIQVVVSDEMLQDPEMANRARQFGQEFRAGVLTNDDIMEKLRGKS